MIIYCTTNLIDSTKYIGYDSKNNPEYLGSGIHFKRAIKKYGKENFKKQILEYCDNFENLVEAEIYWIDYFNADKSDQFYNIAKGGQGGDLFTNHPNKEELRIKMSLSHKGKSCPWLKGKKRARYIIEKVSKTFKERYGGFLKPSQETKNKMSLANKGMHVSKETVERRLKTRALNPHKYKCSDKMKETLSKVNSKAVIQLDLEGKYIAEFESGLLASKFLKLVNSNGISSACTGRQKSTAGFKWMFKTDFEDKYNIK